MTGDTALTAITPKRYIQTEDTIPIKDKCKSVHVISPVIPARPVTTTKTLTDLRGGVHEPTRSTRDNQQLT